MTGLTPKEREALSYLYELNEFKAFKKLCAVKRAKVAELIIQQDMSQPGADKVVSMLQGQAYSYQMILEEMRSLHKKSIDAALKDKSK